MFAITSAGGVIRTTAAEIKQSGRQTMGVRLVNLTSGQTLVAIARNEEISAVDDVGQEEADEDEAGPADANGADQGATEELENGHDNIAQDHLETADDAGSDGQDAAGDSEDTD